jgi:hypothetical protein
MRVCAFSPHNFLLFFVSLVFFFLRPGDLQHAEIRRVAAVILLHAARQQGHIQPREEEHARDHHRHEPHKGRNGPDEHVAKVLFVFFFKKSENEKMK